MSEHSTNDVHRIEVITSVQRRRRWSVAEKLEMVDETEHPGHLGGIYSDGLVA